MSIFKIQSIKGDKEKVDVNKKIEIILCDLNVKMVKVFKCKVVYCVDYLLVLFFIFIFW